MGTLGCINDMLRRDKENRELRRKGRERMKDTYLRLAQVRDKSETADVTPEQLELTLKAMREKEQLDKEKVFRFTLGFVVLALLCLLLIWWLWL